MDKSERPEIKLSGGNSNASVVRIGDTVRRTTSAVSPTVHKLLRHMESRGINTVPRFIGIDKSGREIISYLEGQCSIEPIHWQDEQYLLSAATLINQLHNATNDYPFSDDDNWGYVYADASKHEVICHNDLGPYNLIANSGKFTGIIDFDLAGPGPRLRDIAYVAYWLVPLSVRAHDMRDYAQADIDNQCVRLKRFCSACGVKADIELLDMVSDVLAYMGDEKAMLDTIGHAATQHLKKDGHLAHWQGELDAFNASRSFIERHLF